MKEKVNDIAKEISRLNKLEISDLISVLLNEHDISATIYRFGTASYNLSSLNGEYSLIITNTGINKLLLVKTIKGLFGLGLKNAKRIVDDVPCTIKDNATWSEAEELRITLEAIGAKIEVNEN